MNTAWAWLFPGQGSQYPSMGRTLIPLESSVPVFECAEALCKLPLRAVMAQGPAQLLRQPEYLEPAIVALQIAGVDLLRKHGFEPGAVAGYSLGEIAALYCAGCLTRDGALSLAVERGKILARHASQGTWRSLAISFSSPSTMVPAATTKDVYTVCYNSPRDFTITGPDAAVRETERQMLKHGATVTPVEIDGPWHCCLAAAAAAECARMLQDFEFAAPSVPVCLASAGRFERDPEALKDSLASGIESPVLWSQTLEELWRHGVRSIFELAPGHVLTGFVRSQWLGRDYQAQFMERNGGRLVDLETLRNSQEAFFAERTKKENVWTLSA